MMCFFKIVNSQYYNKKIPGVFVGTINADTPLCPLKTSERAITIIAPPSIPLVTQAFVPFKIQWFPSHFAVVCILAASLPLPNLTLIKKNMLLFKIMSDMF